MLNRIDNPLKIYSCYTTPAAKQQQSQRYFSFELQDLRVKQKQSPGHVCPNALLEHTLSTHNADPNIHSNA